VSGKALAAGKPLENNMQNRRLAPCRSRRRNALRLIDMCFDYIDSQRPKGEDNGDRDDDGSPYNSRSQASFVGSTALLLSSATALTLAGAVRLSTICKYSSGLTRGNCSQAAMGNRNGMLSAPVVGPFESVSAFASTTF